MNEKGTVLKGWQEGGDRCTSSHTHISRLKTSTLPVASPDSLITVFLGMLLKLARNDKKLCDLGDPTKLSDYAPSLQIISNILLAK